MARIIEGFHMRYNKILTNKRYRWFIPKALDSKISKGDIVLVKTKMPNGESKLCGVIVLEILENDKKKHEPVIAILSKYNEEIVNVKKSVEDNKEDKKTLVKDESKKRRKISEEEKESIKAYRALGKTLKEIAEIHTCSISTIHKIIKS